MESSEYRIPLNSRVKLRDGRDNLYKHAYSGSVGWVRDRKMDKGFPMVYIKWDKKHWTYNGEEDVWTFEDHFDIIDDNDGAAVLTKSKEKTMGKDELTPIEILEKAFKEAKSKLEETEKAEAAAAEQNDSGLLPTVSAKEYALILEELVKNLTDGEAFLAIAVNRYTGSVKEFGLSDAVPPLVATVYSAYRNVFSGLLIQTQLSRLAALNHADLVRNVLEQELSKDETDSGE